MVNAINPAFGEMVNEEEVNQFTKTSEKDSVQAMLAFAVSTAVDITN